MSLRPGKDDDKSIITDMNKIIDHVNVGGFSSCASYLIQDINGTLLTQYKDTKSMIRDIILFRIY